MGFGRVIKVKEQRTVFFCGGIVLGADIEIVNGNTALPGYIRGDHIEEGGAETCDGSCLTEGIGQLRCQGDILAIGDKVGFQGELCLVGAHITATGIFMIPEAEESFLTFCRFEILHFKTDLHDFCILGVIFEVAVAVYIGASRQGLYDGILGFGIDLQSAGKCVYKAICHYVCLCCVIVFDKLPVGTAVKVDALILGIILILFPRSGIIVKVHKQRLGSRVTAPILDMYRKGAQLQNGSCMGLVLDHYGIIPGSTACKGLGKGETVGAGFKGGTVLLHIIGDLTLAGKVAKL